MTSIEWYEVRYEVAYIQNRSWKRSKSICLGEVLYEDSKAESKRMRQTGVKFNMNILPVQARKIVKDSTSSLYGPYIEGPKSSKLISEHLNTR